MTWAGLEKSTGPLIFTSASDCRASENLDYFQCINMPIIFVVQGKDYFKIFQGLPYSLGFDIQMGV